MEKQLTWLGHNCWQIRLGNSTLVVDPFLPESAPVRFDQVEADYLLVSHGHADHCAQAVDIAPCTLQPQSVLLAILGKFIHDLLPARVLFIQESHIPRICRRIICMQSYQTIESVKLGSYRLIKIIIRKHYLYHHGLKYALV